MKTTELIGDSLNFAVARALGKRPHIFHDASGMAYLSDEHAYSTDWAQGGPIMDNAEIDTYLLERGSPFGWIAEITGTKFKGRGTTRLIAAMRCFVTNELGDEVEIPKELK